MRIFLPYIAGIRQNHRKRGGRDDPFEGGRSPSNEGTGIPQDSQTWIRQGKLTLSGWPIHTPSKARRVVDHL
jgi:hypothetical protein